MKYVWSNRCRIANVVICSLLCCCNDTKYFLKLYDVYWILRFQACNAIAKAITIENNEKAESRIEIFQHQHQDCNGCLLFTVCAHKLCFIPVFFFSSLLWKFIIFLFQPRFMPWQIESKMKRIGKKQKESNNKRKQNNGPNKKRKKDEER